MSRTDAEHGKLIKLQEKVERLNDIITEYKKENQELRDENENLWFMLDEMKESQKFSAEHASYLEESIKKQMVHLKLMQGNKGEA